MSKALKILITGAARGNSSGRGVVTGSMGFAPKSGDAINPTTPNRTRRLEMTAMPVSVIPYLIWFDGRHIHGFYEGNGLAQIHTPCTQ
jgi:hypothetical protein